MAAIDTATRTSLAKALAHARHRSGWRACGTVYALRRVLSSNKLDLHDLAGIVEAPPIAPNGSNGRGASGFRDFCSDNVETEFPWRDMVATCMRHIDRFTANECGFIRSMNSWCGDPSAKQLDWLVALFERAREMP
jgi:hypothetical protein